MDIAVDYVEIDPNFEPLSRVRSNTWPLRPLPVEISPESQSQNSPGCDEISHDDNRLKEASASYSSSKAIKSAARRNAWGNLSYADLITNAIKSSPDQRLTLSQIYDWMVQNVPFFRDKGESNSSAGWKNSIRHNLSLHNRFMRVPNEGGAGKSSWWVINPDAKLGKTQRSRRSNSMETKAMEKKRFKVRKRVEALRSAEANSSPTHLLDERYASPIDPGPFRDRTSSNASTLSGRLSPIPSFEKDIDDDIPPWNTESMPGDKLVDSLMDSMRIIDGNMGLATTPEESMLTENIDTGYTSGTSSLLYNYSPNNLSYTDITRTSPVYRDAQNISPPCVADSSKLSPELDLYRTTVYHQQLSPADTSGMVLGLSPRNISVETHTSPYGSPQRHDYMTQNISPYHVSPHLSTSSQPLNQTVDLSPGGIPVFHQLSPGEVRKLILNTSTNPHLLAKLRTIPPQNCSSSRILKILTDRTNSQLSQTQIQKLKLLTRDKFSDGASNYVGSDGASNYVGYASPSNTMDFPSHSSPMAFIKPDSAFCQSGAPLSKAHLSPETDHALNQFVAKPSCYNDHHTLASDVNINNLNDIDVHGLENVDCDVDTILSYELSLGGDLDFNFDSEYRTNSPSSVMR